MINLFQLDYETRLLQWNQLRSTIQKLDTLQKCIEVDRFWQAAPLVNHYLYIDETASWPDPWQLLVENTYCTVARALGMCYTLLLVGIEDIQIVEATNKKGEEVVLVFVNRAKYILNYWPGTVVNNSSADFKVNRIVNATDITQKLK